MKQNETEIIRPFLRWAGGKQKLLRSLLTFAPPRSHYNHYFEPFIGAGSLFFGMQPKSASISDINGELINCYTQVARHPRDVASEVANFAAKDSNDFFYKIRSMKHNRLSVQKRAARFIYLNKAAFNGIYRVNQKGEFNVPYGPSQNGPAIPKEHHLIAAASCLANAKIVCCDFEVALAMASSGDFIYIDPPYPPRSLTAYFTHYSSARFDWKDQVRVSEVFKSLAKRGCLVMPSNVFQKNVNHLYGGFKIHRLSAVRWLGSNGDRFKVHEMVVTNYDPKKFRL